MQGAHVYPLSVNKSFHRPLPDPKRVPTHHPQTWVCASGGSAGGFTVTLALRVTKQNAPSI